MSESEPSSSIPTSFVRLLMVPKTALVAFARQVDPENSAKYCRERQSQIVHRLSKLPWIPQNKFEKLFNEYRYPRRIALYIYLVSNSEQITFARLKDALSETVEDAEDASGEVSIVEDEHVIERIGLCEEPEESFDDIREWRFRYVRTRGYVDQDENPATYKETRHGFVWIDDRTDSVIVLSRDETAVRRIAHSIGQEFDLVPVPAKFSKKVIRGHFEERCRRRYSHHDPITGERSTVARPTMYTQGPIWEGSQRFDLDFPRPTDFFEEQVYGGTTTGIGITSEKGRIYLTRIVTAPSFRSWAPTRIRDLVADVRKEFEEVDAIAVQIDIDALGIGIHKKAARTAATQVIAGVIAAVRNEGSRDQLALPITAEEIQQHLPSYFFATGEVYCEECLAPTLIMTDTLPVAGEVVEDFLGHRFRLPEKNAGSVLQPSARFVSAALDAASSLLGRIVDRVLTLYISNGAIHLVRTKIPQEFVCEFDGIDVFSKLATPIAPLGPGALDSLESRLTRYHEKCGKNTNPHQRNSPPTAGHCAACVQREHADRTYGCLLKLFSKIPGYAPAPHGGTEFGDVSFLCRIKGNQWQFKGMIKGYKQHKGTDGGHPSRSPFGQDLISQVVTQYFCDGRDALLGIITCSALSADLKANIIELVRRRRGNSMICFVGKDNLVRLLYAAAPISGQHNP